MVSGVLVVATLVLAQLHLSFAVSYKDEKEAFVSNLKGTSVGCIFFILAHSAVFILLLKMVQMNKRPRILRDFAFLVFPMLVSMTILADQCYWSLPLIVATELYIIYRDRNDSSFNSTEVHNFFQESNARKSYLTLFKGMVMLITCISILAVDFKIFPRRFAKTETFGASLMDFGIGAFIVSSGLTSSHARGGESNASISTTKQTNYLNILKRFTILLLGVGRMILLKTLNYQEHASEYGLHWNFFVTLFFVWNICDLIHKCLPIRYIPMFAGTVLFIYQVMLSSSELTDYVLAAPRSNLFSANREGILSLFGFIPMFLLAESFSRHVFFIDAIGIGGGCVCPGGEEMATKKTNTLATTEPSNHDSSVDMSSSVSNLTSTVGKSSFHFPPHYARITEQVLKAMCMLWTVWLVSSRIQQTSRRLTNLTYVSLVLAISASLMLLVLLAEVAAPGGPHVRIATLEHMNESQLCVFLVANILTGLINMSMKTIYMSNISALFILSLYAFAVISSAWLCHSLLQRRRD